MDLSLGFLFCSIDLYFCLCASTILSPYCLDDCGFVVEPEVRQVDSSSSILLSQDCFGYLRFFIILYDCEIIWKNHLLISLIFFYCVLVYILFISALIAVAKTSRTMLNSSGESGHPCLVPDLRGNAFSFSPLKIMFAVGLSYMAFTMLS